MALLSEVRTSLEPRILEETRQLAVPDEVQVLKPLLSFIEKAEPILKTADSNWREGGGEGDVVRFGAA